jgi:branched-chain amino acid transport system substrate-binding protein
VGSIQKQVGEGAQGGQSMMVSSSTRPHKSHFIPINVVVAFVSFLTSSTASADNLSEVRKLASALGPLIGSASSCQDIAGSRVQTIIDSFRMVIEQASTKPSEREDIARVFDGSIKSAYNNATSGKIDCRLVERQLGALEQSLGLSSAPAPSVTGAIPTAPAQVPPEPPQSPPPTKASIDASQSLQKATVQGITDHEIRFGAVLGLSGATKENGRQMNLGINAAFAKVNDEGGVNGRQLKLITYDDGYEPSRTLEGMKQLYERDRVFGFIGNTGTPTAAASVPYALEHRALFFAPYTGANVVRRDPPDRYVFNYKPSYVEETEAAVKYLLRIRKISPRQIAAFVQNDAFGDAGYAGVMKTYRALSIGDTNILKLTYVRNTIDVDDAVKQLRSQKVPIRAIVMTATYRAAAKFIEKTRDLFPGLIYTNVSAVGPSSLAEELVLLGPRFTENIIVTHAVPAVAGYSSLVLDYKNMLQKYFPSERPDYFSLEGFIAATLLIDALRRCGSQIDTEKLVDTLESTHNLDLGLGVPLSFSRSEHQASHKVWGTSLNQTGIYQPIELE